MDSISNEVPANPNEVPRTSGNAVADFMKIWLQKISKMTLEEIDAAADEAYEELYMADLEAQEASRMSKKAFDRLHAITKTSEKDSFLDLNWLGSRQILRETREAVEAATEECFAALRERRAADHKLDRSRRLLDAIFRAREKRPMTDCKSGGASCSY